MPIDIHWVISLTANGGRFTVPDGTSDTEIHRMVDEQVNRSIERRWSPSPSLPKDSNR